VTSSPMDSHDDGDKYYRFTTADVCTLVSMQMPSMVASIPSRGTCIGTAHADAPISQGHSACTYTLDPAIVELTNHQLTPQLRSCIQYVTCRDGVLEIGLCTMQTAG
jgi:hypothetical protein